MADDLNKIKKVFKLFSPSDNLYGTSGIFRSLYQLSYQKYIWLSGNEHAYVIEQAYINTHSGEKTAVPFFANITRDSEGDIPDVAMYALYNALAKWIDAKFGTKWDKLYKVTLKQYNPIENYNMTQTETPNITKSHTGANTDTANGTRTVKNKQTVSQSHENDVYGFNSVNAVPESENSTNTTTQGAATDNVETNQNSVTHAIGETETETGTRGLTRSGNIGVTTSQQMLTSEIALWRWLFLEEVFNDVDSIIALAIYDID